jgi:hypothetical protein
MESFQFCLLLQDAPTFERSAARGIPGEQRILFLMRVPEMVLRFSLGR